jgi:hypothetical protein
LADPQKALNLDLFFGGSAESAYFGSVFWRIRRKRLFWICFLADPQKALNLDLFFWRIRRKRLFWICFLADPQKALILDLFFGGSAESLHFGSILASNP